MEQYIRKITTVGGGRTYSITIPKWMIKDLEWKKGQKVVVEYDKKKKMLKVRDWEK